MLLTILLNLLKPKVFFKWQFYKVEELNENLLIRNNRILANNENIVKGMGVEQNQHLSPFKKRGRTSLTRYNKIKMYHSNKKIKLIT